MSTPDEAVAHVRAVVAQGCTARACTTNFDCWSPRGLAPVEALHAATFVPARRFDLDDRGWIAPEARADLVLVDGDPLPGSRTASPRVPYGAGAQPIS
ncbi:amidohydrolase family protein [Nocardia sp. NPDC051570]|uniref:amidohydrolase family protein n=1 Tax=Nocardia sp. NPDC051570 TaxID=3364324 RepID=UPI00379F6FE5